MLWWLLDPAHPWLILINSVLASFDGAAIFMLCHAMNSDICDVDEFSSGERREGLFGALYGWVYKTGNALSLIMAGYILIGIGYKGGHGGLLSAQTAETLFLLKAIYCLLPISTFVVGALIMRRYAITRATANATRAALETRRQAKAVL